MDILDIIYINGMFFLLEFLPLVWPLIPNPWQCFVLPTTLLHLYTIPLT